MKCKIFRDFDTDKVVSVLNNQGQESSLYREAFDAIKNEEGALDIWATSFLPDFQNFIGDSISPEQEPRLEQVLKYINNSNTNETLSKENVMELVNNLQTLNIETPDILYHTLKRTFFTKDGIFQINRDKLRESKLYSESEINNLMTYPSVRAGVREIINKLGNTLKSSNNLGVIFMDNSSIKEIEVQDSTSTVGIGKFKNYLAEDVRDYILKNTKGFSTEVDLLSKIQSFDNLDIKEAILNNPEVLNMVREMVKNSKSVPVLTEMEGNIIPKLSNDLVPTLINTLRIGESTEAFTDAVEAIKDVSVEQWYSSPLIQPYLKSIELEAAKFQIDVVGLSESFLTKSREEVLDILNEIDNFLFDSESGAISNVEIYELSSSLADYFNKELTQEEKVIPIQEKDKGRNLSLIETSMNELEMYKIGGYIKVKDNLYQKTTVYETVEEMVNDIYDSLQTDISILPDSVLDKVRLRKNGLYHFSYLNNPTQKSKIIRSILELASRDTSETMGVGITTNEEFNWGQQVTLYKHLLNIPLTNNSPEINIQDFKTRKSFVEAGANAIDYLTSDFISDFYTMYLEEKAMNTPIFESTLRFFDISDRGVVFTSTNPLVQNQVKSMMEDIKITPYLQMYSAISKENSLEFLIPEAIEDQALDIQDKRDFVVNNPMSVEKFSGFVTRINNNTVKVTNKKDEFIRLKDGMYELTDSNRGVSLYSKLPLVTDPIYYVFNVAKPILDTELSANMFEINDVDVQKTNKIGVSKSEVKNLKEIRSCQ